MPAQDEVDAFLPPFEPRQVLDPDEPVSIGAMVGPEAFTEVKVLQHAKQMRRWIASPRSRPSSSRRSGAAPAASCARYRTEDAETVVVALGSVLGTIEDDGRRAARRGRRDRRARRSPPSGRSRSTRCAPRSQARGASSCSRRRSPSGSAGSSRTTCASALAGLDVASVTVIAGLGGRPITQASLRGLFADAVADRLEPLTFLDLDARARRARAAAHARAAAIGPARREHAARHRRRRPPSV